MNIQNESGIGWTKVPRWNPMIHEVDYLPGATWNPTAGCFHGCTWKMPDGTMSRCYAKDVAEGLARKAYPFGFAHHYWHADRLNEPLAKKKPHGIFVGSMADLFGSWVAKQQIDKVIDIMRRAHWHTFLVLTKNPKRLVDFSPFPSNVWVGMSLPTDDPREQLNTAIYRRLNYMGQVQATVRFLSAEPLWRDAGVALENYHMPEERELPLEWIIIGAMSKGAKVYQPNYGWASNMVMLAEDLGIPVYMKHNIQIRGLNRLTDFPIIMDKDDV